MASRRRHPRGQAYGATDELGYHAAENRVQVADLHATILHQLGLNDRTLTCDRNGRDERGVDGFPGHDRLTTGRPLRGRLTRDNRPYASRLHARWNSFKKGMDGFIAAL